MAMSPGSLAHQSYMVQQDQSGLADAASSKLIVVANFQYSRVSYRSALLHWQGGVDQGVEELLHEAGVYTGDALPTLCNTAAVEPQGRREIQNQPLEVDCYLTQASCKDWWQHTRLHRCLQHHRVIHTCTSGTGSTAAGGSGGRSLVAVTVGMTTTCEAAHSPLDGPASHLSPLVHARCTCRY
jgi:hypothetical protein